jgi:hypothetical protein
MRELVLLSAKIHALVHSLERAVNVTSEMKKGRSPVLSLHVNLTHQAGELELPPASEYAVFFQLLAQSTSIEAQNLSRMALIVTRVAQNTA